jgi:hypothetical protein
MWQLPRIAMFTLLSVLNTCFGVLTRLIFGRRIREVRLHPSPIFVLGHWRTGTTFLHELLASDPRFVAPRGHQCGAPNLFLMLETTFRPLLRYVLPERRPMDDMVFDLERPQEDEFALLGLLGRSTMRSFIFPNAGPLDPDYLSLRRLDERARARWIAQWLYFLKSVAIRHGDNQRLVLKSPHHTARVQLILRVFPDAKFVHLVRNPLAVYASTVRTWKILSDTQGLAPKGSADAWIGESVVSTFEEMYRCFEEDRVLIAPGNLCELRYEELAADPMRAVQQIYDSLALGDIAQCGPIAQRIGESSNYRANTHRLSGAEIETVARRWSAYTARFGYADVVAEALRSNGH